MDANANPSRHKCITKQPHINGELPGFGEGPPNFDVYNWISDKVKAYGLKLGEAYEYANPPKGSFAPDNYLKHYSKPKLEKLIRERDIDQHIKGYHPEQFHMVKGTGGSVRKFSNGKSQRGRKAKRSKNGSGRSGMIIEELAPVSYGIKSKVLAPRVSSSGRGMKRVQHRELLAVIPGSVAYTCTSTALNPGLITSFPWLSLEALTYEMYCWNALRFVYVPSCSTSSTGSVGMAIDFDSQDNVPQTETEFSSNMDAVSCSPYESVTYNTNRMNFVRQFPNKFCRYGGSELTTNGIATYDLGQLLVFTSGQAGTTTIGRIYAEYDVTFMIPFLSSVAQKSSYGVGIMGVSSSTSAAYFGTNYDYAGYIYPTSAVGNISWYNSNGFPQVIVFDELPIGAVVRIEWRAEGTTFATTPTVALTQSLIATTGTHLNWAALSGTTNLLIIVYAVVTGKNPMVTFGGTTFATLTASRITADLYDSEVNAFT